MGDVAFEGWFGFNLLAAFIDVFLSYRHKVLHTVAEKSNKPALNFINNVLRGYQIGRTYYIEFNSINQAEVQQNKLKY